MFSTYYPVFKVQNYLSFRCTLKLSPGKEVQKTQNRYCLYLEGNQGRPKSCLFKRQKFMLLCQKFLILCIFVEDGGITYQLVTSAPKRHTWPLGLYRQSQHIFYWLYLARSVALNLAKEFWQYIALHRYLFNMQCKRKFSGVRSGKAVTVLLGKLVSQNVMPRSQRYESIPMPSVAHGLKGFCLMVLKSLKSGMKSSMVLKEISMEQ